MLALGGASLALPPELLTELQDERLIEEARGARAPPRGCRRRLRHDHIAVARGGAAGGDAPGGVPNVRKGLYRCRLVKTIFFLLQVIFEVSFLLFALLRSLSCVPVLPLRMLVKANECREGVLSSIWQLRAKLKQALTYLR